MIEELSDKRWPSNTRTTIRVICIASLPGSQGVVVELRRNGNATELDWTFLSNHAYVLICIAQEPEIRLREVAAQVGITERAVQRIVADLEEAGYLSRRRMGRRNRYELRADRPFRHPVVAHRDISLLLYLILGEALPNGADLAT
jgi:DNA-binding transcriptional ArsR family regulator